MMLRIKLAREAQLNWFNTFYTSSILKHHKSVAP